MSTRSAGMRRERRALRRRDAGYARDAAVGPSMTPMVDVVLVILIFFMASTAFIGPEWLLRSVLPTRGTPATDATGAFALPPARFDLDLSVAADGSTVVSGMGLSGATMDEAQNRVRAYAARLGAARICVFIGAESSVAYQDVVRLHEVCAKAGIEGVGLK